MLSIQQDIKMRILVAALAIWGLSTNVFARDLSWKETRDIEEAVGKITYTEYFSHDARDHALAMLAEWIRSDGEYQVAADQFLKLLERCPDCFFSYMSTHQDVFTIWLRVVQAASFTSPYLHTNLKAMEDRRLRVIAEMKLLKGCNNSCGAIRSQILKKIESFHASAVD